MSGGTAFSSHACWGIGAGVVLLMGCGSSNKHVSTALSITTQPASITVAAGASASFSVVAAGNGALSYQWNKDGTAISGATRATYAIPTVASSDAGSYAVTITDSSSSLTSSAATLTVMASADSVYYQSGGSSTKSGQTYRASTADTSGVEVVDSGAFDLSDSTITTRGDTTSNDNSSFYGQNAGVLAATGSTIRLTNCTVTTTGTGANGVFAYGSGSTCELTRVAIHCTADGAHGVDATNGGSLSLTDCTITTAGAHGAALSTDRGGGTVTVAGGTYVASGTDSPGIYSTGTVSVANASVTGAGSEAAVIEGANSITATDSILSGATGSRDRCVLIYQSTSGDATGNRGCFTMTEGSLTWASAGPVFYVTNTTGVIRLSGVTLTSSSDTLVKAAADQWGTSGSNGGAVELTVENQILTGSLVPMRSVPSRSP